MTPSSRPPIAASTPISRDQVLHAALTIVDEEGVEALSMRRLGRALGRDPMAAYRYADT